MQTQLFIDGRFVTGEGSEQAVLDPATGETIVTVPEASAEQITSAVEAASTAFESWSGRPPAERAGMLLELADRIEDNAEAFARIESRNCGKPYQGALEDEIPAITDCFRFFAGAARCMSGSATNEHLEGFTSMIRREPSDTTTPVKIAPPPVVSTLMRRFTTVSSPTWEKPLLPSTAVTRRGRVSKWGH